VAKIRGIKPETWTDETFVELSPYARLLWIGLWNFACDNGHLQDKSKQIKMRVLPTDDVNCAELLREIEGMGLIERSDGWITIPNLTSHQKPHKRWYVVCDKPGCEHPDGTSYGFEKPKKADPERGSTVEQPLVNDETASHNGGSTADVDVDGDVELKVSGKKPTSRKRPATRLPDDWEPTEKHWERTRDGIDVAREVQAFRLHAEANDRRQANWNAAFSQWLLNARPTPGNVHRLPQHDEQGRTVLPPLPGRTPWGN